MISTQKDAFYFPHDANANGDPKCVLLIEQLGMEGYGIFWVLVETLRNQPDYSYPLMLVPALARRYNTTGEKMKAVITGYGLFQIREDDFFYSDSLNRRMEIMEEKREKHKKAGLKSAEKRGLLSVSNDVGATLERRSTIKEKESIKKESTVDDIQPQKNVPAPADEFQIFRTWEQDFGFTLPRSSFDELASWHEQDGIEIEVICEAIKIAAGEGKRSLKFVKGILENWRTAGVKNLDGAKNYQAEWKAKKGQLQNKDQPLKLQEPKPPKKAKCLEDFYAGLAGVNDG